MVSDTVYEICLPVLKDSALEDEEKTDRLEELLHKETTLRGRPLEEAILGALWRYRDATSPSVTSSPARGTLGRRVPTTSWQISRTSTPIASPLLRGASPVPALGFSIVPPALSRAKSSTASPFCSPRPSPRLAFSSPIPHSPNLNCYEFSEHGSTNDADYGDYGSDTVDWLVNDDSPSRPSSSGAGSAHESTLNRAAPPWISAQEANMSPYDMLRSILGESKSDEEIEGALESNGYDLSATIMTLMEGSAMYNGQAQAQGSDAQILIGKSMLSNQPITISRAQGKSSVVCKYWLASGTCLRADCRFSHDLNSHICRFWLEGNCLAGDSCLFSHDPSALVGNLNMGAIASPSSEAAQPSFQVQDYDAFPPLQAAGVGQWSQVGVNGPINPYNLSQQGRFISSKSGFAGSRGYMGSSPRSQGSRPTSRHSSRPTTPSVFSVDDTDAFPSLDSVGSKSGKKHYGKRGGHGNAKESVPNTLADVVRMSPSPSPALLRKGLVKARSYVGSRENSAAAKAIPPPEHVPWLETGDRANQAYIRARQDAFKHGGLRNKFLQSAAQAWNRNDARAAKALSLRGQSENELMRKSHREAARVLCEERNKDATSSIELYVDLHGLHPEEAVEYLEGVLLEQQMSSRPLYAITGTGHLSKNGKDKVGKAVRTWLTEWKYAFREFSVPGDRGNVGGILGVDARSFDRSKLEEKNAATATADAKKNKVEKGVDTEAVVTKEIPTGPRLKV